MRDAVILATSRTPIGRAFKGSLVEERPDDLSAFVIRDLLAKVPEVDPTTVEDVIWGCGQPAGESGYNVARVASILAGLQAPGVTVNRYCSSSLQTIRMATHAIAAGEGDCFVAGGVESISRFTAGMADDMPKTRNPQFATAEAHSEDRSAGGQGPWTPSEHLPDIYISMGQTAENVAELCDVSRQRQDEFACMSQNRAEAARDRGFFEREITPYPLADGRLIHNDDGIRAGTTLERLADLLPVFRPEGTVTAGNCCALNDGAAAVLVASAERAAELGVTPLARIIAGGISALNPEIMGLGPIEASRQALARAGMTIDDIDQVELNEAFAVQVIASADELGIDWEKLNPNGGAIALGHPFGMTGSRIMGTLLNGLEDADGEIGLETMCVGGGQGMAMIVQRLR